MIKPLYEITKADTALAGGKGASLGEMLRAGIPVPSGFVVTPGSFTSKGELSGTEIKEIEAAFKALGAKRVAVRSSAVAEDEVSASWAGQLETFLNVEQADLLARIRDCRDSIRSESTKAYAAEQELDNAGGMAVVVQTMIDSELSGVMFTTNPITGARDECVMEVVYGLGELLVQGKVTPENLVIDKLTARVKSLSKHSQTKMMVYDDGNKIVDVPSDKQGKRILSDAQIHALTRLGKNIEQHYGASQDIEWAIAGSKIYILQSRPITAVKPDYTPTSEAEEWELVSPRTLSILEENLRVLCQSKVTGEELGISYQHEIIVQDHGRFVLKNEAAKMAQAIKKILPQPHYILLVDELGSGLTKVVSQNIPSYPKAFEPFSKHLAYYSLAKPEAEAIYSDPGTSDEDKKIIESWRNERNRWESYDKLWEKISEEVKVPVEDLHFLLIDEVIKLLSGQEIDLKVIEERKASIWSLVVDGSNLALYLDDRRPFDETKLEGEVVKGQTAYSSGQIVRGIVGKDILVRVMTGPDMVSEIAAAHAVITDEGGILCHAAIICRELKVPCIVGTKVATWVLHDGDEVEVDTEHGTVRVNL